MGRKRDAVDKGRWRRRFNTAYRDGYRDGKPDETGDGGARDERPAPLPGQCTPGGSESDEERQQVAEIEDSAEGYSVGSSGTLGAQGRSGESPTESVTGGKQSRGAGAGPLPRDSANAGHFTNPNTRFGAVAVAGARAGAEALHSQHRHHASGSGALRRRDGGDQLMPWRDRMQDSEWRVSQRMRHRLASRQADTAAFTARRERSSHDPYRGRVYDPENGGGSSEDDDDQQTEEFTARSGTSRGSSRRNGNAKDASLAKKKKKKRQGRGARSTSNGGAGSGTDRSGGSR